MYQLPTPLQAGAHGGMGPHAGTGAHAAGPLPWIGPGVGLLLWVLLLLAVGLFVWRLAGRERRREAVQLLEAQYARGEIDEEEFEHRRDRLNRS